MKPVLLFVLKSLEKKELFGVQKSKNENTSNTFRILSQRNGRYEVKLENMEDRVVNTMLIQDWHWTKEIQQRISNLIFKSFPSKVQNSLQEYIENFINNLLII